MATTYIQSITLSDGTVKQYDYEALGNKPDLVTETTVTDWGFTKQAVLTDTDNGYGQRVKTLEDTLASVIDVETQSY